MPGMTNAAASRASENATSHSPSELAGANSTDDGSAWRSAILFRLVGLMSPRHVLLAGARDEALCRALAEAACRCGAILHVSAHVVPGWLKAIAAEAGDHLMVHAAQSAEAISVLPTPELAWIDEDRNWPTVHRVLGSVLDQARRLGRPFPVTLVSGTGGLLGRIDLFDNPDPIPAPRGQDGIYRDRFGPGGQDSRSGPAAGGRAQGTEEAAPRCGVLTAVEDFVSAQDGNLRLALLPGFGGFGAVTPGIGRGAEAFSPAGLVADLTELPTSLEATRLQGEAAAAFRGPMMSSDDHQSNIAALAPSPSASAPSYQGNPATEAEAPGLARLRASPAFDAAYYVARNADVLESRLDPALHYLRHGADERRDPNPFFSTGYYLDAYPDVAGAGLNPVLHYLSNGAAECRNPGPRFATRLYIEAHPEVTAAGINPLEHFLTVGLRAGWQAPPVPK